MKYCLLAACGGLIIGVIGTLSMMGGLKGCGTDIGGSTNVIVYTNMIYENKPKPLSPVVKTNGSEVCLDIADFSAIHGGYIRFSTDPFVVVRSNDTLSVSLHTRKTVYKIPKEQKKNKQELLIGLGYPFNVLVDYTFFYGVGVYTVVQIDRVSVGVSYKIEF